MAAANGRPSRRSATALKGGIILHTGTSLAALSVALREAFADALSVMLTAEVDTESIVATVSIAGGVALNGRINAVSSTTIKSLGRSASAIMFTTSIVMCIQFVSVLLSADVVLRMMSGVVGST